MTDFPWPDHKISEFIEDMRVRSKPDVTLTDFAVNTLAEPMPSEVKAYYNRQGGKYHRIRMLPCVLRCERCQSLIQSEWMSVSAVKEAGIVLSKSAPAIEICKVCKEKEEKEIISAISRKWEEPLKIYNELCLADHTPRTLDFTEYLEMAKGIFNNNTKFFEYSWTIRRFESLRVLIKKRLVTLTLADDGVSISFVRPNVEKLSYLEHEKLFMAWAMDHVQEVGSRVCAYSTFEMSLKYQEELKSLLAKASFYDISYSLYRAEKEAISSASMKKIPKSVTFKNVLMVTLKKLRSGEWQVSPSARAEAERTVPDEFWRLVRLKEHNLPAEDVLKISLRLLSRAIECDSLKEELRDAFWEKVVDEMTGFGDLA